MAVPLPSRRVRASLAFVLILSACVAPKQPAPPPAPPTEAPPPPPPPQVEGDWRDMPLTPGDWRYSRDGADSVARFGQGVFEVRCDRARRTVRLTRQGPLTAATPSTLGITTSTATLGFPAVAAGSGFSADVPATHSGLDQMAFSRGRFVVAVAGLPKLYVPTWPEFARVVEDCRRPA